MVINKQALQESLAAALRSSLLIIKLVIPLYILADILLYFDLLKYISFLFSPLTSFLGLPVEAAMALAGGVLLNLYAAIAFAAPLGLSPYQWTVMAVFLGVCHSMVVESAIMKRLGVSWLYSIVLRVVMAFVTVLPVMLMPESFFGATVQQGGASLTQYDSLSAMLTGSTVNAAVLSFKIICLITLIIFFMDWLKSTRMIKAYADRVSSSFSIIVGQLLGITYGAGILIREVEAGRMGEKDIFFVATVLMICHAVIEDTLLFVIFGANLWVIVAVRVVVACIAGFLLLYLFSAAKWLRFVVRVRKFQDH